MFSGISSKKLKENLATMLPDFDPFTDNALDYLETEVERLKPNLQARSPADIDHQNVEDYRRALAHLEVVYAHDDKPTIEYLQGTTLDSRTIPKDLTEKVFQFLPSTIAAYAFVYGNYKKERYGIKIIEEETNDPDTGLSVKSGNSYYVTFPTLLNEGKHSVLVHVYKNTISRLLTKGYKNSLVNILEKAGVDLDASKLPYLFPKGHVICPNKDDIDPIRKDLEVIFNQMKVRAEKRDFSELKYFVVNKKKDKFTR